MKKFDENLFYKLQKDGTVQPTYEGIELIIQYLNNKYQTNICFVIDYYGVSPLKIRGRYIPIPQYKYLNDFINGMNQYILEARSKPGYDYREFYLMRDSGGHAVFMAYIREGQKEGIFYSDSLGTNEEFLKKIYYRTGIRVLATLDGRQADDYSCYTDALVFGRDITAIDPLTGHYRIPNLLTKLKERVEFKTEALKVIKLPNDLLKTAQRTRYMNHHKNDNELAKKIHKNESLDEFLSRYKKNYLQEKGWKNAKIIPIQFYINQIENELGRKLPQNIKIEFIAKAKKEMVQGTLHEFCEGFLHYYSRQNGVAIRSALTEKTSLNLSWMLNGYATTSLIIIGIWAIISTISFSRMSLSEHYNRFFNRKLAHSGAESLANKYNISFEDFSIFLDDLIRDVNKMHPINYIGKEVQGLEKNVLEKNILSSVQHPIFGLAATEFLLKNYSENLSPLLWNKITITDIDYAEMIISNKQLVNRLFQRGELYVFGCNDAYIAKKIVEIYPDLLDEDEKTAFQWISTYESNRSKLCSREKGAKTQLDGESLTADRLKY